MYYPLIVLVVWVPGTINRISNLSGKESFTLYLLQYIFMQSWVRHARRTCCGCDHLHAHPTDNAF